MAATGCASHDMSHNVNRHNTITLHDILQNKGIPVSYHDVTYRNVVTKWYIFSKLSHEVVRRLPKILNHIIIHITYEFILLWISLPYICNLSHSTMVLLSMNPSNRGLV